MALNIRNKQSNDGGITTQPADDSLGDSLSSEINQKIDITLATLLPNLNKNINMKYLATRPRVAYTVTTVNKSDLTLQLGKPIKSIVPPLISFTPSLETTSRRLMNDVQNISNLSIANGQIQQIGSSGISSRDLRPEIVAMIDFAPIWKQNPDGNANINSIVQRRYSDNGLFLKFQYQTKQIRQDTFINVLKNVRKTVNEKVNPFDSIRNDYLNEINTVQSNINYLKNVYDNIVAIKRSFEIRNISEQNYRTLQGNKVTNIPTLKQYFVENLNNTEIQYKEYSETKIFLQMLYDLQLKCQNVSKTFLDFELNRTVARIALSTFSARSLQPSSTTPNNPINIEKFDSASFSLQNVSSVGQIINASEENFFTSFLSKLPSDPDNRIRLLTYLLAKEYSISRALGDPLNQQLFQTFGISDVGNPFPTIFGDIKDNILTPPDDKTSLAALAYDTIPENANANILIFENKYIEDENNSTKIWIPGNVYYTDQIINLNGSTWNTTRYSNYVSAYNKTVKNAIDNITKMLGLDNSLTGMDLNKSILDVFYTSFDKLTQEEENVASIISRDPAKYQQKLALEAQKRDLTAQLESIGATSATLNLEARARDGGDIGESARRYIEDYNSNENNTRDAIKAKISEINQKLSDLSIPSVPEALKLTTEQALIMSMFNFANQNTQFKRLLFMYCITAGMVRNQPSDQSNIFVILAKKDIGTIQNLFKFGDYYGDLTDPNQPLPTNGVDLIGYLKFLASGMASVYTNSFLPNSSDTSATGVDTGSELLVYLSSADVTDILVKAALGQDVIGNVNLIYQYITLANKYFTKAQINGVNKHLLPDNTGRTRFNSLSVSTQLLMLFEIICQYANKYSYIQRKFSDQINILGQINVTEEEIIPLPGGRYGRGRRFTAGRNNDGIGGNESRESVQIFSTTAQETVSSVLNVIALSINAGKTAMLQKAITLLSSNPKEEDAQQERNNNNIFASLENNKKKIEKEYTDIQSGLGICQVIGQNFTVTLNQILQFFTQDGLKEFLKNSNIKNLDLVKNISQLRISSQIFDDIKKRTSVPEQYVPAAAGETSSNSNTRDVQMIVSDNYTSAEYSLLEKFLSQNQYVPGTRISEDTISRNLKILTVGIPTGFNKNLIDKVNLQNLTAENFQDKQADIISVKVFVRNGKYPQLILKPVSYLFDISLFATKQNIIDTDPKVGERYVDVVNRMSIKDYENPFSPIDMSLEAIKNEPKYNVITEQQKTELFLNHINSNILNAYVNLMTGARISEDIFLNPEPTDRVLNQKARTLMDTYIKAIGLQPPASTMTITDVLSSNEMNDDVKDLYRLFTYGSLVFNQGEVNSRVMTPKIFDRIFYIPVNTYIVEIDIEETLKFVSKEDFSRLVGDQKNYKRFLVQANEQRQQKIYLIDSEPDEFVFKDIFVQVETALNTETREQTRTNTQGARGLTSNPAATTSQTNNRQGIFIRPFRS